jgi:hypothetical protein
MSSRARRAALARRNPLNPLLSTLRQQRRPVVGAVGLEISLYQRVRSIAPSIRNAGRTLRQCPRNSSLRPAATRFASLFLLRLFHSGCAPRSVLTSKKGPCTAMVCPENPRIGRIRLFLVHRRRLVGITVCDLQRSLPSINTTLRNPSTKP